MRFIKLTRLDDRYELSPVWINVDHIVGFLRTETYTTVWLAHVDEVLLVDEGPIEIFARIRLEAD